LDALVEERAHAEKFSLVGPSQGYNMAESAVGICAIEGWPLQVVKIGRPSITRSEEGTVAAEKLADGSG